jgi:hypothetical protein
MHVLTMVYVSLEEFANAEKASQVMIVRKRNVNLTALITEYVTLSVVYANVTIISSVKLVRTNHVKTTVMVMESATTDSVSAIKDGLQVTVLSKLV